MGDVVTFPDTDETEERVLMLLLYKSLGKRTERIAARMADGIADEVLEAVSDIEGMEGCYWVADQRAVH
ncbi:hypothetical protein [Mesorhizobium sp. M8A.F.Ca.ET.165.01.1.1]|uniref:hypothetical protein n=1 Tax=Mesorhizobium sp. M8A.F.Ca.ET.165.01.1.1 TaxID=2563960 RepID=UPI001093D01B|nr:hypothetical protein [Mesorhizobium sp. M8A.F.Ca.ET.165.01.1.1]TGT42791.1 hypothetical protein EN808_12985 [Mesorhizobium sp. M8A.F.Ca.ET.165.01.1.1]